MKLTATAMQNPVAVIVAVILAILFGIIGVNRLPVQLTPEVELPEITIKTQWRAAAPEEVEAEIIEPQEDVLRGLPGMTEMISKAQRGNAEIALTFSVETDLRRALLEVLNRLNRVARYPADAEEPVLSSVGGRSRAIAWFIIKPLPGNNRPIASYQDFIEEVVQTRFERVPGVALSEVRGGREQEVRITFDPYKAANLGVQLPMATQLVGGAKDVSGGFSDVGKRRYTLRFAGKYEVEKLADMVIDWREGKPVLLRDVAQVDIQMADRQSFVIQNGGAAMAVNAHRETGVNVLDVMEGLREARLELEKGPLARANLSIRQVYDETIYIHRSINMVVVNLSLGMLLAVGVLWWFMRRWRATLMVAIAIPISVVTTFVFLEAFGRTINVISLAGIAFAVGMVLDAAIVVLENIVRLREGGEHSKDAALKGTQQVWGALLASTLTTVAIFLPVVFLGDEAGQLFADLALAIAAAVSISLLVAVLILPTAAKAWFKNVDLKDRHKDWWEGITTTIMHVTRTRDLRLKWIAALISIPILISVFAIPDRDYLPEGNRNLVFAFILPPPGVNMDTLESEMGNIVAQRMQPYIEGKKSPHVNDYFFVAFGRGVFMGARAKNYSETNQLVPLINQVINGFPDTLAFARRTSLFGGFGEGRSINVDIQGRNIESLLTTALTGFGAIKQAIPGSSIRPFPGLDLADPELRLVPNERRIAEAGWNREQVSGIIRALGNGLYVGDYFDGEQRRDVIFRGESWHTPEDLASLPLATPNSGVLPLSELVNIERTAGPEEVRRTNRRRTITLQVNLPDGVALEEGINILREKVEPVMAEYLPEDGAIRYSGTADKLKTILENMTGSFLLALAILYLLMSALFRSFRDSILVMVAIPLATVGGILALRIMGHHLDLLTMIGFIILLGLVVNNAILLVYQTRRGEADGLSRRNAVEKAIRQRLRPILMSTMTSIFGMLPLLLMPGAGTELYRGLAGVIVGGMAVSTAFTLVLLPSLLRMGEEQHKPQLKSLDDEDRVKLVS